MKLTTKKAPLLEALQTAATATDPRSTIQHLACVLIQVATNATTITATDQSIGIERTIAAGGEPGETLVNAKRLIALVRELGDEITLATDEVDRLIVTSGAARFVLNTMDPHEFPALPPRNGETGTRINSDMLGEMLAQVMPAMASDETRVNLCGVHVSTAKQRLTLTATDGHRMARTWRVAANGNGAAYLLPRTGVIALAKALPPDTLVDLACGDGVAFASWGGCSMTLRLIEGEYPDVDQVIPEQSKTTATVGSGELAAMVRRVAVMSSERTQGVQLDFGKTISASTINPDCGEASDSIDADVSGQLVTIGVKASYLLDAIDAVGGEVVIGVSSDVAPLVVTSPADDAFIAICMPMRL